MISRLESLLASAMMERYPSAPVIRDTDEGYMEEVVTLTGRPIGRRRVTFEAVRVIGQETFTIFEVVTREDKTVSDEGNIIITDSTPLRIPVITDTPFPDAMQALKAAEKTARVRHRQARRT